VKEINYHRRVVLPVMDMETFQKVQHLENENPVDSTEESKYLSDFVKGGPITQYIVRSVLNLSGDSYEWCI